MSNTITIALDAMGGDNAPSEICAGAVEACKKFDDIEIVLTGNTERIKACSDLHPRIRIEHASEIIDPDEHPANAIRKKRDSSLRVAMEMVRRGDAQGCVSAGSTGAIVAGGALVVGRKSPSPSMLVLRSGASPKISCSSLLWAMFIHARFSVSQTLKSNCSPTAARTSREMIPS